MFCLFGILIYVFAGLLPLSGTARKNEGKIDLLKKRIDVQQVALPLFQDLQKRLNVKASQSLPFPAPAKIPRDEIGKVKQTIQEMAQKNNLTAVLIAPDMDALVKETTRIAVVTELKGDLFDFRNFLIAINGLPYVTRTAEMQIRQTTLGTVFMLKVNIEVS